MTALLDALDTLQAQDSAEVAAYRSPAAIEEMVRGDFSNADAVLAALRRIASERGLSLAELFSQLRRQSRGTTRPHGLPLPLRTAAELRVHRHTTSQIAYWHAHDFIELVYVLAGSNRQAWAKSEPAQTPQVSGKVALAAHTACLIHPGFAHRMDPCRKGDLVIKVSIPPAVFGRAADDVPDLAQPQPPRMLRARDETVDRLVCLLLLECTRKADLWERAAEAYLEVLLIEFVRPARPADAFLEALGALFADDPARFSLGRLAARLGYSDDHTGRLCRKLTGRSFSAIAGDLRVTEALRLLETTDRSVASIAREMGYAGASGLHKQILKRTGMTPGAWRGEHGA